MRIKVLLMTVLLVAVSNTNVFSQDMETKKTVTPQEVVENVHDSVASIIREYTQDDRKEAPEDSNQFLGIK